MKQNIFLIAALVIDLTVGLMLRQAILAPDPSLDSSRTPLMKLLAVTNDMAGVPVAVLQITNRAPFRLNTDFCRWGYQVNSDWIVDQPISGILASELSSLSGLQPGEAVTLNLRFPTNDLWKLSIMFRRPEPIQNRGLLLRVRHWWNDLVGGGKYLSIQGAGSYSADSPAIYRGFSADVRNKSLLQAAATLLTLYSRNHDGKWPGGWRDVLDSPVCPDFHSTVRDITQDGQLRYLARPEDFEHYVHIDWNFDTTTLHSPATKADPLAFRVIRFSENNAEPSREETEINQKLLKDLTQ